MSLKDSMDFLEDHIKTSRMFEMYVRSLIRNYFNIYLRLEKVEKENEELLTEVEDCARVIEELEQQLNELRNIQ